MSRHNRRRTRGSHSKGPIPSTHSRNEKFELPSLSTAAWPDSTILVAAPPLQPQQSRRTDLTARHWHNRYLAWQTRERRQREEREKLETEQRRIFGGDPGEGDDEGLCTRMWEYFGGLDFIEG